MRSISATCPAEFNAGDRRILIFFRLTFTLMGENINVISAEPIMCIVFEDEMMYPLCLC
ncbi:hypothetical protein MWSIV6_0999 [Methanothermobacter wolfeii]|nr:hypothetical protein MWSIV6_0999 [Methanothermobacter wolfeii]